MELLELLRQRRSIRSYTQDAVPEALLEQILQAGLLSPTGHNARPWEFIVVQDKGVLNELSRCRTGAANMLLEADCAIVVAAEETKTDVWVEDCAVAMAYMHLMAESLGVGSCWVQVRQRQTAEEEPSGDFVRGLLRIPESYRVEAILSLGMPARHPAPHGAEELLTERIHRETF